MRTKSKQPLETSPRVDSHPEMNDHQIGNQRRDRRFVAPPLPITIFQLPRRRLCYAELFGMPINQLVEDCTHWTKFYFKIDFQNGRKRPTLGLAVEDLIRKELHATLIRCIVMKLTRFGGAPRTFAGDFPHG